MSCAANMLSISSLGAMPMRFSYEETGDFEMTVLLHFAMAKLWDVFCIGSEAILRRIDIECRDCCTIRWRAEGVNRMSRISAPSLHCASWKA